MGGWFFLLCFFACKYPGADAHSLTAYLYGMLIMGLVYLRNLWSCGEVWDGMEGGVEGVREGMDVHVEVVEGWRWVV